jgi:hypothetical protein
MAKLVFDIETSALSLEQFDDTQLEYLFRDAEKLPDQIAGQARKAEIQQQFSLWPFTAQVVCIAMVNVDSSRGKVLYTVKDPPPLPGADGGAIDFVPCLLETDLLQQFWDLAQHYSEVITFNGRSFDVPFLYLRSALLNVPISRKDWLGARYQTQPHCDLAEQFTFYSVSSRDGAARRFNLDFYCKAFGIQSPKSQGITGRDVSSLLEAACYREIAEYCLRDVMATVSLYRVWRERLWGIR